MESGRNRHLLAWAVVVWTFGVTVARAIRLPNDFSEAYWLLDYRFGFIKRGLVGTICSFVTGLFGREMNPRIILALSIITFSIMFASMFFLLYRSSRQNLPKDGALALGLVFASSPFVVMNAHLLGYFDALLYLFTMAAVGLTLKNRPRWAGLVSVVALLAHESYFLTGFPLVCFASVAVIGAPGSQAKWRTHLPGLGVTLLIFVAIPLAQALTTDAMVLCQNLATHLDTFGFVSTRSSMVAEWQTTSFWQFFRELARSLDDRLWHPVLMMSVGPSLLAILAIIYSSFRIRVFGYFSFILLGAVVAPLAMHAVAWDTARIVTYLIGGAFLAWWILAETRGSQKPRSLFLILALLVVVLNALGRMPLMDDQVERFSDLARLGMYLPAVMLLVIMVRQDRRGDIFH